MIQPDLDRRTFLTFGLAAGLGALSGFGAHGVASAGPFALKPFAHSRTVSSFAKGLFFCEGAVPLWLRQAIEAELARTQVVPDTPAKEQERAAFFAWLAVRNIAPRALRRAGYDALAVDCEKQSSLWNGMLASASAQHAIGRQYAYSQMPQIASLAYGACAHAATTTFYAGHEDVAVVVDAGHYCARALLDGSLYDEEIDAADSAWIWGFAAWAINSALDFDLKPGQSPINSASNPTLPKVAAVRAEYREAFQRSERR